VLAVLARRCGWLGEDERESIFHDAYVVFLQKQADGELQTAGMHPRRVRAYLVRTALNKALDEGKRAERRRSEPIGERALREVDGAPAPEELAFARLESARLREIVAELPDRGQTVVKLRFYFDRTPEEIQRFLGLSERVYRRELERAMRHVAERYTLVRDGRFCDSRRSLIQAYVAGIAGPNRSREAAEHLGSCPACAHWAAELRESAERAAALLPLPLPPALAGPEGLERLRSGLDAARDGLTEILAGVKQQAAAIVARLDPAGPGYALAARPGGAAAAVIGCLAIGGGTTYCFVDGFPLGSARESKQERSERPSRADRPELASLRPVRTAAPGRSVPRRESQSRPAPREREPPGPSGSSPRSPTARPAPRRSTGERLREAVGEHVPDAPAPPSSLPNRLPSTSSPSVEMPDMPEMPDTPAMPQMPEMPQIPDMPQTLEKAQLPRLPELPELPVLPDLPELPELQGPELPLP